MKYKNHAIFTGATRKLHDCHYFTTGAASYAFISAVKDSKNLTYTDLLASMRECLNNGIYTQEIQMCTSLPKDMNIPFIF